VLVVQNTDFIRVEIANTFPELQIFQNGGPYYLPLKELLLTYFQFRPDATYVRLSPSFLLFLKKKE
jgi:hypothetical protein